MDNPITLFTVLIFTSVFFGVAAALIPNNNAVKAFFLGLLLGPLGVAFVLLFHMGNCTHCGFPIGDNSKMCPGCKGKVIHVKKKDGFTIWPCEHCGALVKNKSEYSLKSFPCPTCKASIQVPSEYLLNTQVTVAPKHQ